MKRKILALLVLTVFCFTMFVGCKTAKTDSKTTTPEAPATTQESTTAPEKQAGPLFDKPVTLRMLIGNHASWPYQSDWEVVKLINEKTNVTFDILSVEDSGDNMTNRIIAMMASKDVPELTYNFDRLLFQRYGMEGAYANLLDHMDKMPNFKKFMEDQPEVVNDFRSADGKLYIAPDYGIQETDQQAWLYRKDIFDKHSIKVPTNDTELYDACKKLKELYPESYPLSFRRKLNKFEALASAWGTHFIGEDEMYYDYSGKVWRCGGIEDNFKNCLQFYNKLYNEKLIPPDFLSLETKGWQDLMTTDKAFITHDYLVRIDFFNNAVRPDRPEFNLAYMIPPKGGANGVNKVNDTVKPSSGFGIAANSLKLNEALKYMDWLYTPEARDLLSWGEVGRTYEIVEGRRKFIGVDNMTDMRKKYGFSTNGMYALFDYDSHASLFSKELQDATVEARKHNLPKIPYVAFTEDEQAIMNRDYDLIKKHIQTNVSEFLLGTRNFSEWDNYVKEVQDLKLKGVLDIYETAYKRQLAK